MYCKIRVIYKEYKQNLKPLGMHMLNVQKRILTAVFALTLIALSASGCTSRSPAPVEQQNIAYNQLQAQAVDHWRDIASEVAARIYKGVTDRPDIMGRPLYIAPPNNQPFSVAFYNLLRSELVSRGLQVSYEREPYSVFIEHTAQLVPFDDSRGNVPEHELVVNARMHYNNRFVMHCSAVRYINDADVALYADPQVADPFATSRRNIRITKK